MTAEVFEKLCFGERETEGGRGSGNAAARTWRSRFAHGSLVAVVEGVEKPGNVGAILRSADAAGVDAVIVVDGGTDLFNPNTIRSSLGTVFKANVVEATESRDDCLARPKGLRAVAARPDAKVDYTSADLRGGVAIVLGSEAEGLTNAWGEAGEQGELNVTGAAADARDRG